MLVRFGATRVDAVDLDPAMIRLASRRLARYGDRVRVVPGSATACARWWMPTTRATTRCSTSGVVHHISDWRNAEVARVMRPGGRFYFEGHRSRLGPPHRSAAFRPPRDDRFTVDQFLDELTHRGLVVPAITRIRGDYLLGPAKPLSGHPRLHGEWC